ncbi:Lysophosphatidic acid receptor 1 [Aix galericulata]|nr:Lysophosphatidic acid receptor 1 [Aix galericulata]
MSQPEVIESTAMSEPQCYYNETIAFFYNRSGKYLATEWNTVSKLVMGLGITVCIFIMLANLLVMVAIYVNRRFHFPIYYLMANLAAADFFAGLAYFYLMFNTGPNTRRLTVSTWLLRQGLIDTSLTASVANLLAIAIERHITVFRMQLHTRMSNRRVVVVIVVIWTMAIVMGAIPSVGWNCICDITHCSNMAPLYSDSYLVFWAIFNLVTFVVMVVLYAHIFGYVRQRTMRMSRHSSGPRRNRDTMMSLLKTVVIVLAADVGELRAGKDGAGCFLNPSCGPTHETVQHGCTEVPEVLMHLSVLSRILPQMRNLQVGLRSMPANSKVGVGTRMGAFIICWTPGLVLLLLDVCCPQCNVLAYEKFFLLLAEFNSAMNPIIYSYRDKEMSATFKQILCCQRSDNANGPTEGSDRSASSLNHTILAGVHSNDHSVV